MAEATQPHCEEARIEPLPLPQKTLDVLVKQFQSLSPVSSLSTVDTDRIKHNSEDLSKLGLNDGVTWEDLLEESEQSRNVADVAESIKTVLLVRHAEGHHNDAEKRLGKQYWEDVEAKKDEYFDSSLNAAGERQCEDLKVAFQQAFDTGLNVDLVIVSPLTRAIQTAQLSMPQLFSGENRVPIVAMEWCREHFGKNTPDKRRTVSELKELYPMIDFDHFMVGENDPWWTPTRETDEEVNVRVEKFFSWLMHSPDSEIKTVVVVGHSSYMAHAIEYVGMPYHWPSNCEVTPVVIKCVHQPESN